MVIWTPFPPVRSIGPLETTDFAAELVDSPAMAPVSTVTNCACANYTARIMQPIVEWSCNPLYTVCVT